MLGSIGRDTIVGTCGGGAIEIVRSAIDPRYRQDARVASQLEPTPSCASSSRASRMTSLKYGARECPVPSCRVPPTTGRGRRCYTPDD